MIISGLIALISIVHDIKKKYLVFWLFLSFLILFDGLRWEMGTDWPNYYKQFYKIKWNSGFEIGFKIYTDLFSKLTNNYSIYLFVTTSFIYLGIFLTIFKITNYSFLSIFYLTAYIPWYSGALRQMIACAFFTLAIKTIFEKKKYKFLIFMTIGFLFHKSLGAFFPIYWIFGLSPLLLINIYVLIAFLSIFTSKIIIFLDNFIQNNFGFNFYLTNKAGGTLSESNPFFGFLRKIFTLSGLIIFSNLKKYSNLPVSFRNKVSFCLFMSCLSLIFYYMGTFQISHFSSRLDIYTRIILTSILIGLLDKFYIKQSNRLCLFVFVLTLVIIAYSRYTLFDLFHPYSSIFYNYELNRNLY